MDIIHVEDSIDGRKVAPFLINYTDEDEDSIVKTYRTYCTPVNGDTMHMDKMQILAYMMESLPVGAKHGANIYNVTMTYSQFKNEHWKLLCKPGLHPRDYAENHGEQFSFLDDPMHWIYTGDKMPEQVLEWIEAEEYNTPMNGEIELPDGLVETYVDPHQDLHYLTEKVLIMREDGSVDLDYRRKFDSMSGWIWGKYEGCADIKAWMKIQSCPWVYKSKKKYKNAANNKMDGEQAIASESDCRPLSKKD